MEKVLGPMSPWLYAAEEPEDLLGAVERKQQARHEAEARIDRGSRR